MVGGCHCVPPKSLRRLKEEGSGCGLPGAWRPLVPSSSTNSPSPGRAGRLPQGPEPRGEAADRGKPRAPGRAATVVSPPGPGAGGPGGVNAQLRPGKGGAGTGAWGPPWWHLLPVGLGDRSRLPFFHCVTEAGSLGFAEAASYLRTGPNPPASIA